jgi:type IV pilus assembly protein PilW
MSAIRRPQSKACQRGLSLVELMVGIALGLFVVAGASMVVVTQLGDNRRLLLETQLQQDLRATADIITRELRRAGHDPNATAVISEPAAPSLPNPFAAVQHSAGDSEVQFNYWRGPGVVGPFGFRLSSSGVVQSLLGIAWQDLTDGAAMNVTAFTVTPLTPSVTQIPCPTGCTADPADPGYTACWPTVTVRSYVVDITAQARNDATIQRSIRSEVRARNDLLGFNVPALPNQACPL